MSKNCIITDQDIELGAYFVSNKIFLDSDTSLSCELDDSMEMGGDNRVREGSIMDTYYSL